MFVKKIPVNTYEEKRKKVARCLVFCIHSKNIFLKYEIVQVELSSDALLMFSGLVYVVIYFCLWKSFHSIDTDHLFQK
jgi:hypothetical protein